MELPCRDDIDKETELIGIFWLSWRLWRYGVE
jgi:hypothetical protein